MQYHNNNRKLSFVTLLENKEKVTSFIHFKGNKYIIITIGKNSETLEDEVIYKSLSDNKIWIRKADMFFSDVDRDKYPEIKQKYRFEKMDD